MGFVVDFEVVVSSQRSLMSSVQAIQRIAKSQAPF